jgi:hypothetical protein
VRASIHQSDTFAAKSTADWLALLWYLAPHSCKLHSKTNKLIVIQLLPSELNNLIVELSSDDSDSLAALARTHTAFQREAEKALYDTVYIYTDDDNSLKCMETLATNSEKAGLVRFLIIEYTSDNIRKIQRVTTYLSKSLINMHSLSDFRIRSRPGKEEIITDLDKILWSVVKKI